MIENFQRHFSFEFWILNFAFWLFFWRGTNRKNPLQREKELTADCFWQNFTKNNQADPCTLGPSTGSPPPQQHNAGFLDSTSKHNTLQGSRFFFDETFQSSPYRSSAPVYCILHCMLIQGMPWPTCNLPIACNNLSEISQCSWGMP